MPVHKSEPVRLPAVWRQLCAMDSISDAVRLRFRSPKIDDPRPLRRDSRSVIVPFADSNYRVELVLFSDDRKYRLHAHLLSKYQRDDEAPFDPDDQVVSLVFADHVFVVPIEWVASP